MENNPGERDFGTFDRNVAEPGDLLILNRMKIFLFAQYSETI